MPNAAQELPLAPIAADEQDLLTYIKARQGESLTTPIDAATTPVSIRLQLRRKGKGRTPALSNYFKEVRVVIKTPTTTG